MSERLREVVATACNILRHVISPAHKQSDCGIYYSPFFRKLSLRARIPVRAYHHIDDASERRRRKGRNPYRNLIIFLRPHYPRKPARTRRAHMRWYDGCGWFSITIYAAYMHNVYTYMHTCFSHAFIYFSSILFTHRFTHRARTFWQPYDARNAYKYNSITVWLGAAIYAVAWGVMIRSPFHSYDFFILF